MRVKTKIMKEKIFKLLEEFNKPKEVAHKLGISKWWVYKTMYRNRISKK